MAWGPPGRPRNRGKRTRMSEASAVITLDKFHDECAVVGVYGHKEAANLAYLSLYALQHRGQESSGIVSNDGEQFHWEKAMGLVADVFTKDRLKRLPGRSSIGHNRYSTAGSSDLKNAQPLVVNFAFGNLALAHNGNLINAQILRNELEAYGAIFQSTSDSEVIIHLIAQSKESLLLDRIFDALNQVRGAFSITLLTDNGLIAARDPWGFRPLCLGRIKEAWVVASETCAFDLIGADAIRDIEPGELILMDDKGLHSYHPFPKVKPAMCIFEHIYFARPDSKIYGNNVYAARKALGRQLAKEFPVPADIVIPVPDSGVPAALGYAEGAHIPFEQGLIRNHYVGRTFIEPEQRIRHFGVKVKLNAVPEVLEGKRVVVVDDSIVRGITSRKIVKMIRHAGAKEVHMRISSPPIISPCFYGIDTPTKKELIGSTHSIEETRKYITADSLAYLSLEGLLAAAPGNRDRYSNACFTESKPGVIVITGDLTLEGSDPAGIRQFLTALRDLKAAFGIWAVLGNHDHWYPLASGKDEVRTFYNNAGVSLLVNEGGRLGRGLDTLSLIGVDDPFSGYANLGESLRGMQRTPFAVLLTHSPEIFMKADLIKFALVLAGHTHGGQVRLPGIGARWPPAGSESFESGWFYGQYARMYVTRGIGTSILPVRLFCRPEIALIPLRRTEPKR